VCVFTLKLGVKLQYVNADVSCVCELILLFCVVFCLVIDGHKFQFGLVVN